MKIFLALGAAVFLATSAGAAEIGYQFKTIDINGAPGQTSGADPIRLNDRGQILANAEFGEALGAISTARRGTHLTVHLCPESIHTEGTGISNPGDVVGFCYVGETWHGFISRPNGSLTLLDYPGSLYTFAQGISPNGVSVVGQFWSKDFNTHCFVWNSAAGTYREIVPWPERDPAKTFVNCFALVSGYVLGEYIFFDENGEYQEHSYFVWKAGKVTKPLPLSTDYEGGPAWLALDRNNDGQILVLYTAEGGINSTLVFYDDGVLFDVKLPDGVPLNTVGGMNGRGQFVGRYQISAGVDPECYAQYQDEAFCTIYKTHGFIASPVPIKVASEKK